MFISFLALWFIGVAFFVMTKDLLISLCLFLVLLVLDLPAGVETIG